MEYVHIQQKRQKKKEIQKDKSILHNNWYNTVYRKYYSDMMTKNREKEDDHGGNNQEKWFAFTYCGKEVKYVTKLFKGAHVKIAYKISNTIGKILGYNNMSKISKCNISGIYQLFGSRLWEEMHCTNWQIILQSCNEHHHPFKYQNSAFAKHLHDTGHLSGPVECFMDTLHFVNKRKLMNSLEKFCIYSDSKKN